MDTEPEMSGSPIFETLPFQTVEDRYLELAAQLLG